MPLTIRAGRENLVNVEPQTFDGWISTRLEYGLNDIASRFTITVSNKGRCDGGEFPLPAQTPVSILADGELALTGWVDDDGPSEDRRDHRVTITGRSRGGDLVDCSHYRESDDGWEWEGQTALQIAQDVVAPFEGISVSSPLSFDAIDEFRATMGDTAFMVIEELARREGVLMVALPDGSISLERAARDREPFVLNCPTTTTARHSYSQRFSEYHARGQQHGYDNADADDAADVRGSITDDKVARYRPRIIQPEGSVTQAEALRRIQWQRARDRGDSLTLRLRLPGFQSPSGEIWRVNRRLWVERPRFSVQHELLIAAVAFTSDNTDGDMTELLLKPPAAYEPEPRIRRSLQRSASKEGPGYFDL